MNAWLAEAERVDHALYGAVARADTPRLDVAMRRLSHAANYSRLSLAGAALLSLAGVRGRRAAVSGLVASTTTAGVVNALVKPLGRRERPDRVRARVPLVRHVPMPASRSFPSGHTAAAVAFAAGVGRELPPARFPLYALAAAVGYSRVHTGVHYPGDVLAGAGLGLVVAEVTNELLTRREPGASSGSDDARAPEARWD